MKRPASVTPWARAELPLGSIAQGDVLAMLRALPTASVHQVITSPPYYGLRDYRQPGQGGLESTFAEHLEWLVGVFREVRRVLRPDGTVWMNYGDGWANSQSRGTHGDQGNNSNGAHGMRKGRHADGLKPKDLIGMAWRVAFALQADGWWLRDSIVWAKALSFCPGYSGSCMPESITDRTTRGHEYLFLLTPRARYFYDAHGCREEASEKTNDRGSGVHPNVRFEAAISGRISSRNLRSVWVINPQAYPGAHFAVFPEALVEPCIRLGTSERGACPACGAPWARVVAKQGAAHGASKSKYLAPEAAGTRMAQARDQMRRNGNRHDNPFDPGKTLGWRPTCACEAEEPVPCVVLDPFAGSGTTLAVAYRLGREALGIDLAGGDIDHGGFTPHDRIRHARGLGPPVKALLDMQARAREAQAAGQQDLLGGDE